MEDIVSLKWDLQDPFLEFIDPSSSQIKDMVEKSSDMEFSFVVNISSKPLENEILLTKEIGPRFI